MMFKNFFGMQGIIFCESDKLNSPPVDHFGLSNQMKKYVTIFFLVIVTPLYLLAQSNTEDLSTYTSNKTLENAVNLYNNAIEDNSMILTGGYYNTVNIGINGHPFYANNYWETSTIVYKSQRYDSIEIRYDIYGDLLIMAYIDKEGNVRPIQLQSSKVEGFTLIGHHFVRLEADTLSVIKTGFFDLLYDGDKVKVLAKRKKEISRKHNMSDIVREYFQNDILYIKSDHNYYVVKGKKSLMEVLSERKNEIKVFLKKNKAKFRKDHEKQLIETVKYYNSIVNNEGS